MVGYQGEEYGSVCYFSAQWSSLTSLSVEPIATNISPGAHVLNCQLLNETLDPNGGKEFRIFAVMHD